MQEIKNCPFCGREILYVQKNYDPAIMLSPKMCVKCNQCGACGPLADDDNEAILKWNSRIQDVPQEKPNFMPIPADDFYMCPFLAINKNYNAEDAEDISCKQGACAMWIWVGEDKGRCGLVNTMYVNSTGCGV